MVAIDLGAGSCRVSLLRWVDGVPEAAVVHRFANGPVQDGESLRWPLDAILQGVEHGLRLCAEMSGEPIASVGVDGWAVDYVRLKADGSPLRAPFCYRDPRNEAAEAAVHARIGENRLYALTGLQRLRFNTIYQLYADKLAGIDDSLPWANLPEYALHRLGARIAYASGALIQEPVPPHRAWLSWLLRRSFRAGQSHARALVAAGGCKPCLMAMTAAKCGYCVIAAIGLAYAPSRWRAYAVRGALHAGVVSRLAGVSEPELY